jgi:hypothetical protein
MIMQQVHQWAMQQCLLALFPSLAWHLPSAMPSVDACDVCGKGAWAVVPAKEAAACLGPQGDGSLTLACLAEAMKGVPGGRAPVFFF